MTNERILPHIYVDCVEFFNEKLISNFVSLSLDNILKKYYRDNGEVRPVRKYFQFKTCRSFPMLMDHLQELNVKLMQARKSGEFPVNSVLEQTDFFFYIILDNVSNVLS